MLKENFLTYVTKIILTTKHIMKMSTNSLNTNNCSYPLHFVFKILSLFSQPDVVQQPNERNLKIWENPNPLTQRKKMPMKTVAMMVSLRSYIDLNNHVPLLFC